MIAGFSQVESWSRLLVPALLVCALLCLQVLPWPGSSGGFVPCLALMGIVYFSARLPVCCPPLFAFVVGCWADLLELTPLGAQGLAYLAVVLGIRSRRRRFAEQAFLQLWGVFGLIAVAEILFMWIAEALLARTVLPLIPMMVRAGAAIVLFPIVVKFLLVPAERMAREAKNV